MLRLATITRYSQDAWLTKIGWLPGRVIYEDVTHPRLPSTLQIQEATARYFHIPVSEMTSAKRSRYVARPRQIAMYLSRCLTSRSMPEIGRRFGGRDHTTVIHAIRQIEKLMVEDSEIALAVLTLTKELGG
jgi:chromosomal replication initiator protein